MRTHRHRKPEGETNALHDHHAHPAQAQRLINTYYYVTEPEPDAVERLIRGALSLYDTPRGDLVEFECDVYGEPVSWLSLDEINVLVYGG